MTSITFTQISNNTRVPGAYAQVTSEFANRGTFDYPTRILAIGQKTASGTATALEHQLITSDTQAKTYFGRGSTLALMCEAMLNHNRNIEIRAIAQDDDAAGVVATGSIAITSSATISGTINLYIAGVRVRTKVTSTNTLGEIATALAADINDNADLPVTANVDGGTPTVVDLTAKNKGECGNDVYVMVNYYDDEQFPQGFTLTITQMSGGTGNPDINDVIHVVDEEWFTDWLVPYTDAANMAALDLELDERFSATGKKDTFVYSAKRGTHSNLITYGQTRNCEHMAIMGMPAEAPSPSFITAADLCINGAYFSNQSPARPYMTVPLLNTLAPKTRFNELERELLLQYGIATFDINVSGTVMIERLITTYQKTDTGIESAVFLDITSIKTLSHMRYDLNAFLIVRYFENGKIITSDEVAALGVRDDVVSPKTIQASINARQQLWRENGWTKDINELKAELDGNDPTRINVLLSPEMTSPLMIIATKIAPTY